MTAVLRANAIAAAQAAFVQIMTSEATVKRNVGGTWGTVVTSACTFRQFGVQPQENMSQTSRLFIDDRWQFSFPIGTDVRFADRIVLGTRTFEVIQVPIGTVELTRKAICQELDA